MRGQAAKRDESAHGAIIARRAEPQCALAHLGTGVRKRGGATFVPARGGRFPLKGVETLRFVPTPPKRNRR